MAEDLTKMFYAGHRCALCSKRIMLTDSVAQLEVVYPAVGPNGILAGYAIEGDDGGYEYDPYHFHLECWDELHQQFFEEDNDAPPVYDPARLGIVECLFCSSDIRAWETSGMVSYGEIRRSQRSPNDQPTTYFELLDPERCFICLPCLWTVNKERLDMWTKVTHVGECEEGMHMRCWRLGAGSCGNACKRI